MIDKINIRTYHLSDLPSLVTLINEADAVDKMEEATTLQELEHQMSFPTDHPETDCFLAWDGDRLVGYTNMYVAKGAPERGEESTIHCWGVVHPEWRRNGLGRRLLQTAYNRAEAYLGEITTGRVNFQCDARDIAVGHRALYEGFGMTLVRYFVNLARPLGGNLPPIEIPDGIRLRTFDPKQDAEQVWRVGNVAFRDHWGHSEVTLDEFLHWIKAPHMRPELWFLAEEQATDKIVGMGLNVIDPDWIAQTGRQEGYVTTLAVMREYRKMGLGTAILVQSLHALRQAGMEAVHLHADADNLTGAMRLYERVGFRLRKTIVAYQRVIRAQ